MLTHESERPRRLPADRAQTRHAVHVPSRRRLMSESFLHFFKGFVVVVPNSDGDRHDGIGSIRLALAAFGENISDRLLLR